MLDFSLIVVSPEMYQHYKVLRSSGSFIDGVWTEGEECPLFFSGVITIASANEIDMIPEADKVYGAQVFYSPEKIYVTHIEHTPGISDKIEWRDHLYRIYAVFPYVDYGYWKALGARMIGA